MALNIPQASEQALAGSVPGPGTEIGENAKKIEGRSPWRLATQRLLHDKASMISLGVIVFIILIAIFAPPSRRGDLFIAAADIFCARIDRPRRVSSCALRCAAIGLPWIAADRESPAEAACRV